MLSQLALVLGLLTLLCLFAVFFVADSHTGNVVLLLLVVKRFTINLCREPAGGFVVLLC